MEDAKRQEGTKVLRHQNSIESHYRYASCIQEQCQRSSSLHHRMSDELQTLSEQSIYLSMIPRASMTARRMITCIVLSPAKSL